MKVAKMSGPELIARTLALEGIVMVMLERAMELHTDEDKINLLDDIENRAKAIAGNVSHPEMNIAADKFVDEFISTLRNKHGL